MLMTSMARSSAFAQQHREQNQLQERREGLIYEQFQPVTAPLYQKRRDCGGVCVSRALYSRAYAALFEQKSSSHPTGIRRPNASVSVSTAAPRSWGRRCSRAIYARWTCRTGRRNRRTPAFCASPKPIGCSKGSIFRCWGRPAAGSPGDGGRSGARWSGLPGVLR